MTRRIGLIAYPGFTTLDLTGPLDVFDNAAGFITGAYETIVLAVSPDPLSSEAGRRISSVCTGIYALGLKRLPERDCEAFAAPPGVL